MHEEPSAAYGLWQTVPAHEESFSWYDVQKGLCDLSSRCGDLEASYAEVMRIAHAAADQIDWMISYISSHYDNTIIDLGGGYCAVRNQ